MTRYKIIIFTVILIASLVILIDKIFTTAPIQIILESGEEVTTQNSNYYTLGEVILLIVSAFLIGLSSIFLYYNSDGIKNYPPSIKEDNPKEALIINLLKNDEKRVYQEIRNSGGEILQNKLVLKTGLSKVKTARVIQRLKLKGLIVKERYGLTNRIKLKFPPG